MKLGSVLFALALTLGIAPGAMAYDIIKVPAKTDAKGFQTSPAKEYHTGLRKGVKYFADAPVVNFADDVEIPADFDLRDFGVVASTKNQGSRGTCWSFSKTKALEGFQAVMTGVLPNLSEEHLASCDKNNWGSNGGLLNGTKEFQYHVGQTDEASFPYQSRDSCKSGLVPVAKLPQPSFEVMGGSGATKLKNAQIALMKYHTPAWITVSADNDWGSPPSGDMAVWSRCGSGGTNHAIALIGWRTISGKVYLIVQNSWGDWGSTGGRPGYPERGFALLALGCDSIGDEIAFIPAQPKPALAVKAPLEVVTFAGVDIPLDVQVDAGVTYKWSTGETSGTAWLKAPKASQSVTVTGTKAEATASATVKVTVL